MKFVTHLTLLLILFGCQFSIAQAPEILWTKIIGGERSDYGNSIKQTRDGGYIIAGNTDSFSSMQWDFETWLIKTDARGDTLWTKTFGEYRILDEGHDVIQTPDEGYVVTGMGKYWLIKTNAFGDTLWTRTTGAADIGFGNCIRQADDGGFIICGEIKSGNWTDIWLVKTNSSGDIVWSKSIGGIYKDTGNYFDVTNDNGFIIAGNRNITYSGSQDFYLVKTDAAGDTLWTRTYGGSLNDYGYGVQQTMDGGYMMVGTTYSFGAGQEDIWIVRTDSSGDTLWTRTFGTSGFDKGCFIKKTSERGYIICGSYNDNSAMWLIKINDTGDTLWTKTIGSDSTYGASCLDLTDDGGYIINGYTAAGPGGHNIRLVKTTLDLTSIDTNQNLSISKYHLYPNYPNPFNPHTTITFNLLKTCNVTLKIFNILGQEVATLVTTSQLSGSHAYEWDASNFPSGIYLYRLQAGDWVETKKMVLMR